MYTYIYVFLRYTYIYTGLFLFCLPTNNRRMFCFSGPEGGLYMTPFFAFRGWNASQLLQEAPRHGGDGNIGMVVW